MSRYIDRHVFVFYPPLIFSLKLIFVRLFVSNLICGFGFVLQMVLLLLVPC